MGKARHLRRRSIVAASAVVAALLIGWLLYDLTPTADTSWGPPESPRGGEVFRDCETCPEMVVIPDGSFRMGSPPDEEGRDPAEGPVHEVVIAKPFALGRTEVTRGQVRAFAEETGEVMADCFADPGFQQQDDHPAVCVGWDEARAYARWLGEKTGAEYRLPSEAEWEYAARGGTTTSRFWGDAPSRACTYGNVADLDAKEVYSGWAVHDCQDGYVQTAPVGSFEPNRFGLHDVLGNVWEWTEDCWNESYEGAPEDGSAWLDGDCSRRVLRGGSWGDVPGDVRSAFRGGSPTTNRDDSVGFRVARTLP